MRSTTHQGKKIINGVFNGLLSGSLLELVVNLHQLVFDLSLDLLRQLVVVEDHSYFSQDDGVHCFGVGASFVREGDRELLYDGLDGTEHRGSQSRQISFEGERMVEHHNARCKHGFGVA